jgi:hypothetical protein
MLDRKVLWNLIGGRWAISYKAAFWMLPILIFGVPIGNYAGGKTGDFWQWSLASALSLIPAFLIYVVLDKTLFRNRHITPVSGWWVLTFSLATGFLKGLTTGLIAQKMELSSGPELLNHSLIRGFNAALIAVIAIPSLSLFFSAYERYRTQRNELMAQALQVQVQIMEEKEVTKGLIERIDASVMENLLLDLRESKRQLEEWDPNSIESKWEDVAESLRSTAKNAIRPLSHLMWAESAEKRQQSIFRNSFVWGLSNLPIYPAGAILFYAISAILSSVSASGYLHGSIYLAIRLIILYGLLSYLSKLRKRTVNPEIWSSSILVALTLITFEGIGWILNFSIKLPVSFAGSIFDFFWILYLLWFVGFLSAFLSKQEEIYVSLNSFISQTEVEAYAQIQESRKISREIAKYLHGTIQSQLMGSAFAIEKAGRAGDALQLEKEIKKAYENLLASPQKYFKTNFQSLSDSIINVTENWNELMDVHVRNLLSNDSVSNFDTERIHSVLDDALSNSFRHGLSTQVIIEISKIDETKIQIFVSDNGKGMQKESNGLGAQGFTAIAGKNWKWVTNSGGGVDLVLAFPSTLAKQG